jgi:phosphinothricin acetyltransferase
MIRLATPEDAPALLGIYAPFVEHTAITFEYEVPAPEDFALRISTVLQQLPWLIHEQQGQITGYAYAARHRDRAAYQWSVDTSVYLHADFHRQGIARSLYLTLFQLLRTQGYYNAYAGITLPNPKSERFHRKMGFTPVGVYEKVGYKLGQWYSVQWFSLNLQEHLAHPATPLPVMSLPQNTG